MYRERNLSNLGIVLPIILLTLSTALAPVKKAIAEQQTPDSLGNYINQANLRWGAGKSDLKLSINLLSEVSNRNAQQFYQLATVFYYWSLRNADFENERKVILAEFERIKPLLPDSSKKMWQEQFEENDPQLLQNMAGFWEVNDPYVSTQENERLVEHWQRIHYARQKFTIRKEPPYGTDERGVYYVRLGMPDRRIIKRLRLDNVIGPGGERFNFEFGNVIQSEVEIWTYEELGDDFFLLFGKNNGWGEYGLRKSPMELIPDDIQIQMGASRFSNESSMRKLSKNVAQYGIYQQLAPFHTHFSTMFSQIETSFSTYNQAPFLADALSRVETINNLTAAPASKTSSVTENGTLNIQKEMFRYLSPEGKEQYFLALQPKPRPEKLKEDVTLFLNNDISIYNKEWKPVAKISDPINVNRASLSKPFLYKLEEPLNKFTAYYSSELIDTTYNGIIIPGKITQKASFIVSTTGRVKLTWPEALNKQDTLLISDIILGSDQEITDHRLPITPTLDRIFKPDADLMVYFEAYNIPEEGYSFTYYFEKHRWLFKNKRPSDKPSIMIVNDKLNSERNSQLFAISLSDLDEGTYDLIFEFRPVGQAGDNTFLRNRKIELVIKD